MWKAVVAEAKSLALSLALVLAVNTAAFANYYIPSESMAPTLLVGDRLVVSKWPYGYSRHSVLGSPPLFAGRLFARPVARGDIVVFKQPADGSTDVIKRIVGLPGDTIALRHDVLVINGATAAREAMTPLRYRAPDGAMHTVARFRETLPEGRSYVTFALRPDGPAGTMGPYVVPPGHYFALGDNRDNSADSRWPAGLGMGFIPAENIVGRAEAIVWSWSGEAALLRPSTWVHAFRGARAVTSLR
jgi:signal peptidase I